MTREEFVNISRSTVSNGKGHVKLKPISEFIANQKANKNNDDNQIEMDDSYKRSPFYFLDRIKRGKKEDGFIYLRRLIDSDVTPYNPYYLERVPHASIDKFDYYTMSAKGVTHFRNGEAGMFPCNKKSFMKHSSKHSFQSIYEQILQTWISGLSNMTSFTRL